MHACAVTLIEAAGLRKVFRKPDKGPGIRGSLKHLVTPRFSEHVAVDGIDLSVAEGEAVAYVGPNGAGKSTTVKMLSGILVPTAGRIHVDGLVPYEDRVENARRIGVIGVLLRGCPGPRAGEETKVLRGGAGRAGSSSGRTGVHPPTARPPSQTDAVTCEP